MYDCRKITFHFNISQVNMIMLRNWRCSLVNSDVGIKSFDICLAMTYLITYVMEVKK